MNTELITRFEKHDARLTELEDAQRAIMNTSQAVGAIEVDYNAELVKKYFQQCPFYSYLKSKGRETSTESAEVGFRMKTKAMNSSFIAEGADLPSYTAGQITKTSQMVSELVYPFEISDKASKGY